MSNPSDWTASEALREIGAGRISPREYAEALLARCENADGLNAFIHLDPEQVLEEAERAAERSGGRLRGLPVPLKDNFDTADMPTTGGTPGLRGHRPARNAPVVQRLIEEGAIVMGKLNMHELAFGITSNNSAFGPARNPYGPDRIPGGSSGGSGAAVGARMAPVALGSDTGGSVRIPAALCGVAGLRPTTGRYSQAGIVPISHTRDTAGPLARSVEDLALFDSVITNEPDGLAATALAGARIGVPRGHFFENLHPETVRVAEEALAALAAAGAVLVEADMPEVPKLDEAAGFPIALYETVVDLNRYLSGHGLSIEYAALAGAAASPDVAGLLQSLLTEEGAIPEAVYREALDATRPALQAAYADWFAANDVLAAIFPTTPLPAARIGEDETVELNGEPVPTFLTFIRNTSPSSVAGIPGVTLPAGLSADGLPIGMELDGPAGSDRALLALSAAVEEILPATPAPASGGAGE
ncbi:MAG: indoleacetamide hydrolase [Rhodospirillaceae bacterium]|nr:indoleacetamide hydrolase [Rhodospirillaceae bacterium]MYB13333.1 indoleacetamide hydrolase [Rhodospirillaceae bacterium]MYI50813.1 indoleacetamide hydrolase [Rhodospirillaceae bacterium]